MNLETSVGAARNLHATWSLIAGRRCRMPAEGTHIPTAARNTTPHASRLALHRPSQDLADVEKRAQAAETRHQELSAKLPEATAPLLRQISALQDASSAQVGRGLGGSDCDACSSLCIVSSQLICCLYVAGQLSSLTDVLLLACAPATVARPRHGLLLSAA